MIIIEHLVLNVIVFTVLETMIPSCSMAHASYQKPEFAFVFCWFGGF